MAILARAVESFDCHVHQFASHKKGILSVLSYIASQYICTRATAVLKLFWLSMQLSSGNDSNKYNFYPHMPIGKVWINRLLFVFLCVCVRTVTD